VSVSPATGQTGDTLLVPPPGRELPHRLELTKPDGRALTLYGLEPVSYEGPVPSPGVLPDSANPHLRWHPLRGEWVAYAAHRQDRTFLPPPEYNPLRPSAPGEPPTELPRGRYEVAVFDNLFPSLRAAAHDPPQLSIPTLPARGACEVVVFSQDPSDRLATLPLPHVELLLQVWGDRTRRLGARQDVQYVLPFENRGVEVGVTLHHPHGQVYAYPFVPPVPARINENERRHYEGHGRTLLGELLDAELADGARLLYHGEHAVAFVPPWARYPYETWVAPRRAVGGLADLDPPERRDLALALKTVLLKFDGLWSRPFPYLMAWFQAPLDGRPHPESHLHAEFYPPLRTRERLKYLAGTELAAGMFANDALPEERARELQAVAVDPEAAC
jgi:UDPglucose--hexose-1-phosphate uridylyltransferase